MTGPAHVLPSVFDVTGLASSAVTAANEAAAQVLAIRTGEPRRAVHVDRRAAAAAFLSEVLFTPQGWDRVAMWDPIAGDYRAADGWIRLHTNYRHHRLAAEAVLGAASDRASVAEAVRGEPPTSVAHWSAPRTS